MRDNYSRLTKGGANFMPKLFSVKPVLELRAQGFSMRKIEALVHTSRHTIKKIFESADEKSISWEDVKDLEEKDAYQILFPPKQVDQVFASIDYDYVHKELTKVGVNLKMLWNEYCDQCKRDGQIPCGYTRYCMGYSDYTVKRDVTNRIYHKPGEAIEVDWSGSTMKIVTPYEEVITVYLFVATLPFSQYTYVKPCLDMKQDTWIKCNVDMLNFFGGVPIKIVCDNLKTGVITHPKEGDIVLNEAYESFSQHYVLAIMPCGVRKPKQKASVEGSVGKIATAIIARLRNETFRNLNELNEALDNALKDFNDHEFQKREGSRTIIFNEFEKERLRPLPDMPFEVYRWEYKRKVDLNFHVSYRTNIYSVPYQYVGEYVDLKINASSIEIFHKGSRIAVHPKFPEYVKYKPHTIPEHMPDQFHQQEWNDVRIINWASSIGPNTRTVVEKIFDSVQIKEQGYKSCIAVLKLSNKYSNDRLENACELALTKIKSPRYHHLNGIMANNQDLIFYENKKKTNDTKPKEGFVRGSNYYKGGHNND